jgi:hypothetical protein
MSILIVLMRCFIPYLQVTNLVFLGLPPMVSSDSLLQEVAPRQLHVDAHLLPRFQLVLSIDACFQLLNRFNL